MNMTHYMELLASNQPWNLIFFMAIPVILAETIAVTELYVLFTRVRVGAVRTINAIASMVVGLYFAGIVAYLVPTVLVPLTLSGGWRGIADIIAVGFYVLGVVPLGGLALIELGLLKRAASPEEKLKLHAAFVAMFLVVAHVAMIVGMLDPQLFGWSADAGMQM